MVRASGLVLHFLFFSAHDIFASLPIEGLEAARETASGVSDGRDAAVAKSALEFPDKSPDSLLCRRGFIGCSQGILKIGRSASGALPTPREHRLLRSAQYETAVANAMIAQLEGWGSEGHLPEVIVKIASARTSLTRQYGGFNRQIRAHLKKKELPLLFQELSKKMIAESNFMLDIPEPSGFDYTRRIAFLDIFISFESQDTEFSGPLQNVLPPLRVLKARYNAGPVIAELRQYLYWSVNSNTLQLTNPSRVDLRWQSFHIQAEQDYARFLQHYKPPETGKAEQENILRAISGYTFTDQPQTASILLRPERISLHQFENLRRLDTQRFTLVGELERAIRRSHAPHAALTEKHAQMIMLALVIESLSGSASQEALRLLRILHDRPALNAIAEPYLALASQFHDQSAARLDPPWDITPLQELRPLFPRALPSLQQLPAALAVHPFGQGHNGHVFRIPNDPANLPAPAEPPHLHESIMIDDFPPSDDDPEISDSKIFQWGNGGGTS